MKTQTILLLVFLLTFFTPSITHAIDPGLEGGSCCQTGYNYRPNTCLGDTVPGACSQAAAGVIIPIFGVFSTNICNLPFVQPLCDQFLTPFTTQLATNITNTCINYFVAGGTAQSGLMCAQFVEQIEPTIDGFADFFSFIPGFDPNQIINEFQANCSTIINNLLSSFPVTPTLVPQCVNPLNCDTGTGLCVAATYIAEESPFCDYLTPQSGIRTAIGCLSFQSSPLITTILNWAVGISGGTALILIIIASFQIATATGDPKRLTAGQDLLFSALAGLTLISLATLLLNFIGVNILGLANLGFQL